MEKTAHILPRARQEEIVTQMCICPECPSWVEGGEKGGFCFETIPKSNYINEESGCICRECPVANRLELEYSYYCTTDSGKRINNSLSGI